MHPAGEIRGIKSKKLSKKKIVLGVTGSIAAIESIKLSRELIRHGADVYPVMTKAATGLIHPDSLEFATSHKPIIELTGKTEHVSFCGLTKDRVDLLLISPTAFLQDLPGEFMYFQRAVFFLMKWRSRAHLIFYLWCCWAG